VNQYFKKRNPKRSMPFYESAEKKAFYKEVLDQAKNSKK